MTVYTECMVICHFAKNSTAFCAQFDVNLRGIQGRLVPIERPFSIESKVKSHSIQCGSVLHCHFAPNGLLLVILGRRGFRFSRRNYYPTPCDTSKLVPHSVQGHSAQKSRSFRAEAKLILQRIQFHSAHIARPFRGASSVIPHRRVLTVGCEWAARRVNRQCHIWDLATFSSLL